MSCFINGEWVSGNIGIRTVPLSCKGDVLPDHLHEYDHTLLVIKGVVRVKLTSAEGKVIEQDLFAPSPGDRLLTVPFYCLVPTGSLHETTALVDDTLFLCVRPAPGWEPPSGYR